VSTGYSGTPLARKLGFKPDLSIAIVGAPANYRELIADAPESIKLVETLDQAVGLVHYFTDSTATLTADFPRLKAAIPANGSIWVSWPKKASGRTTDLDENIVREVGLANGLVDVKVASVDETWSGLKFVYRLVDRP
jgi:hypothetical protein